MNALAGSVRDVYRFRELLGMLVLRDLKVRYKRSALGMAWTLVNPLLQMGVYTVVFSLVLRLGVDDYPVFVLSGLLPWSVISVATTSGSQALLANGGLIRKVAVPQAVYPLAVVASKLTDAALGLPALAVIALIMGRTPGAAWLFLPVAIVLAGTFAAGLALLFASLSVFFRDVRHLLEVGIQIWFYMTPVFYPPSFFEGLRSPAIRAVLAMNPATPIVRLFQECVHGGRLPSAATVAGATLAAAASVLVGVAVFTRTEPHHIHQL